MKKIKQHKRRHFLRILSMSGVAFLFAPVAPALKLSYKKEVSEAEAGITIKEKERCAVCGMLIASHPKWITQILFKGGIRYSFDGVKCLFRFYFNPQKYDKKRRKKDIKQILIRDYYTMKPIQSETSFFVVGSDVLGPMGHELIPFADKKSAKIFRLDHNAFRIFHFDEIKPALLDKLDKSKEVIDLY